MSASKPSKEAMEAAAKLWTEILNNDLDGMDELASRFDAFAAARVAEERKRCAKIANTVGRALASGERTGNPDDAWLIESRIFEVPRG